MIRKALLVVFGLIAALILAVAVKTLFTTSRQLNVPSEKPVTVDPFHSAPPLGERLGNSPPCPSALGVLLLNCRAESQNRRHG